MREILANTTESVRTKLTTAALVLAFVPGVAGAVDQVDFKLAHTEDLLEVCTVGANDQFATEAVHYCIAYIEGAVDYHDAVAGHKDMERLICYPPDATREQGVAAFVQWAQSNRGNAELMQEDTVIGVVRALAAKWPCKK